MQTVITCVLTWFALMGWGGPAHNARPATTPTPAPATVVAASPSRSPAPSPTLTQTLAAATPATAEIASEATCPGQTITANTIAALTCLTNNARRFHGLEPVADNQALLAATAGKVADMAACGYGHTACGRLWDYRIKTAGYTGTCYGENIAEGQLSPHDVFVAWMNSVGHRANILNAQYRDFGAAEVSGSQGPLWVIELGGC